MSLTVGLVANRDRDGRLQLCRQLLDADGCAAVDVPAAEQAAADPPCPIAPARQQFCPCCGGTRFVYLELPRSGAEPNAGRDTS